MAMFDLRYFIGAIIINNSQLLGVPITLEEIPSLLLNTPAITTSEATPLSRRSSLDSSGPVASSNAPWDLDAPLDFVTTALVSPKAAAGGGLRPSSESGEPPVIVQVVFRGKRRLSGTKSLDLAALLANGSNTVSPDVPRKLQQQAIRHQLFPIKESGSLTALLSCSSDQKLPGSCTATERPVPRQRRVPLAAAGH